MTKILIADDDMNLRRILCHFLKQEGFETVEARSGKEALDLIGAGTKPDVLIIDIMMPGEDGLTICKKLKDRPAMKDVPIIICTARSKKEDIMRAIKSGADDYILKPFTRDTVAKKVRKAMIPPELRVAARPEGAERRASSRTKVSWEVSWGASKELGLGTMYKNRVVNISPKGFAFEFDRCTTCTGYELSTVHAMCLLARHAKRFDESEPLEFVLSIERDVVIEVRGKIAHIHQPPDWPTTEVVGVSFTELPPAVEETLAKYTY